MHLCNIFAWYVILFAVIILNNSNLVVFHDADHGGIYTAGQKTAKFIFVVTFSVVC